jgi:ATP-dependent HslUV protease ATP-binding subunit HslU
VSQYVELLATEGLSVEILPEAVSRVAAIAAQANSTTENIGARRLHTVMEKLLEDISFEAPEKAGTSFVVDAAYVDSRFVDFAERQDLSKYIL